jgi:transposase
MERAKERSEIGDGKMGEYRKKYDEDFKKNAVKLSYASPKTVKEDSRRFRYSRKSAVQLAVKIYLNGDKTKFATLEEENGDLRRQLAEARMECDMLKKAAAYFASHQKQDINIYRGIPSARWRVGRNSAYRANRILCLAQESRNI